MFLETTGYLRVCHLTASVRLHTFFALKGVSIWISVMTIHVFIDDRLPTGLPYDGQRFVWTFLFAFLESVGVGCQPIKVPCIHKRL